MARRVFFSFHYEWDVLRAMVVRNSWVTKKDREDAGFWDAGIWEEAKKKNDAAIRRLIDNGLLGTSVTAVLIGSLTAERKYVRYEISQSVARGNGLLGVYIHNIEGLKGRVSPKGKSPFTVVLANRRLVSLGTTPTYDWVADEGYEHFADWVEEAARSAGK